MRVIAAMYFHDRHEGIELWLKLSARVPMKWALDGVVLRVTRSDAGGRYVTPRYSGQPRGWEGRVLINGGQSVSGVVTQPESNSSQLPTEPTRAPEILQDPPEAQPMLFRCSEAEVGPKDRFFRVCGRHIEVAEETSAHTASFERAPPQPGSEVAPALAPVQRPQRVAEACARRSLPPGWLLAGGAALHDFDGQYLLQTRRLFDSE